MLRIEKYIEEKFLEIISKLYKDKAIKPIEISIATNEKFGDFQTNFAMMNSKIIGDNPRKIAEKLIELMGENEIIEKLEIAGPGFINIFLRDSYLGKYILEITKEKFEFEELDKSGEVLVEYSSPNIAKRMHIGHLRSTIIGDSIKRIFKFLGFNTIADNHIGDWGTQFGKLIVGYRNWLDKNSYKENPIEELERVYVKFANESENNSKLEDEARLELKKLQDGNEENYKLWQEFIKVSLDEYNKLYKRMDISFDTYYGESFYHSIMPEVIKELEEKKIAVEDQGAKVVFFDEKENLFPCIVQKKDGAFLYSTSDIATVKYRKEKYNLNRMIYLTDERQQDHFRQFFKITEMLGWEVEKVHLWFGIMRFSDGIFSTRKGNIIKLEELLDEGKKKALEIIQEKNPKLSEEEKENIAEVVGVGAIKYADLSQNKQSPIIFEWDKILSFEGNTAPYLQYSYARVQSILRKAKDKILSGKEEIIITDKIERNLAIFLTLFPTMVLKAGDNYKPNLVTDYLFELAKKFNTFYNACPILNQKDEILKSRLLLIDRVAKILKEGLNLLGIKTIDRM